MTRERRWAKIANKIGYPSGRSVGSILKNHYERILYPFDVFKQGKTLKDIKIEPEPEINEKKDRDYKPHGIISRQQIKPPAAKFSRRSKRFAGDDKQDVSIKQEDCKDECDSDNETKDDVKSEIDNDKDSKELKKLQFYGAGPKMAGFNTKDGKKSNKTRGIKYTYDYDPVSY